MNLRRVASSSCSSFSLSSRFIAVSLQGDRYTQYVNQWTCSGRPFQPSALTLPRSTGAVSAPTRVLRPIIPASYHLWALLVCVIIDLATSRKYCKWHSDSLSLDMYVHYLTKKITQQVHRGRCGPAPLPCQKKILTSGLEPRGFYFAWQVQCAGTWDRNLGHALLTACATQIYQQHLPRLASYCLHDISALSSYTLHRGDSFHCTCQTLPWWHDISIINPAATGRLSKFRVSCALNQAVFFQKHCQRSEGPIRPLLPYDVTVMTRPRKG